MEKGDHRLDRVESDVSALKSQNAAMGIKVDSIFDQLSSQSAVQKRTFERLDDLAASSNQNQATRGMVSWKSIIGALSLFLTLAGLGVTMLTIAAGAILWVVKEGDQKERDTREREIEFLEERVIPSGWPKSIARN